MSIIIAFILGCVISPFVCRSIMMKGIQDEKDSILELFESEQKKLDLLYKKYKNVF